VSRTCGRFGVGLRPILDSAAPADAGINDAKNAEVHAVEWSFGSGLSSLVLS
jgi:hypothetical protein